MNNKKKQLGLTLLELILVTGLACSAALISFYSKQSDLEQDRAKDVGVMLSQYNNASRNWLSDNLGSGYRTTNGTDWLKPTTCGGTSAVEYLPCDFPEATAATPLPFGRLVLTSTINSVTSAGKTVTSVTTQSTPMKLGNVVRSDLAGLSAMTASAASVASLTPVMAATSGTYSSDPKTGIITMVGANNPNTDVWLRTDGTNSMNNDFTFKGSLSSASRNILNVSRIQALAAEVFYLGASGGAVIGNGMVVDADQSDDGVITVANQRSMPVGLRAVTGNIVASAGSVTAGSNVTSGASVTAARNVVAGAAAQAQILYDANNTAYTIDPTGNSHVNNLNTTGTTTIGGRATFGEYLQLNDVMTENSGCSPNGLVARDSSGKILSCVSGVWQGANGFSGSYSNGINGQGSYSSTNTSNQPIYVIVNGGAGNTSTSNGCYDNVCGNTCQLSGLSNYGYVASETNNNSKTARACNIGFWVPAGVNWGVSSTPYGNPYGGSFVIYTYGPQS